ncbi:hypothetical protein C8R43DRAFT_954949 [Mycena crocata]|nr:hypothetical protein C8R43DRAFT_954949 [Mycena crocata]
MSMYTSTPMPNPIYETGPSPSANVPVHLTGMQNAHAPPLSNNGASLSILDAAGIPTEPSAAAARLEPSSVDDFLQVFSTPTQFSEYFRQQLYLAIADVPPEVLRLVGSRAYNTLLAEYQFALKEITGIKETVSHLMEAVAAPLPNYPAFPGPMWLGHPYGQPPILQTTVRQGSVALARFYAEARLSASAPGSSPSSSTSSSSTSSSSSSSSISSISSSSSSIPSYTPTGSTPSYPPSSPSAPASPASYIPSSMAASASAYLHSSYSPALLSSLSIPAASFSIPSTSLPPPSTSMPPPSSAMPISSPSSPTKAPRTASSRPRATSSRSCVAPAAGPQGPGPASRSPNVKTPRPTDPRPMAPPPGTNTGYRHYPTKALQGSYGAAGELDDYSGAGNLDDYNGAGNLAEGSFKTR